MTKMRTCCFFVCLAASAACILSGLPRTPVLRRLRWRPLPLLAPPPCSSPAAQRPRHQGCRPRVARVPRCGKKHRRVVVTQWICSSSGAQLCRAICVARCKISTVILAVAQQKITVASPPRRRAARRAVVPRPSLHVRGTRSTGRICSMPYCANRCSYGAYLPRSWANIACVLSLPASAASRLTIPTSNTAPTSLLSKESFSIVESPKDLDPGIIRVKAVPEEM